MLVRVVVKAALFEYMLNARFFLLLLNNIAIFAVLNLNNMSKLEFYIFDDEVWCRHSDGRNEIVDEHNREIIDSVFSIIETSYPDAFHALEDIYGKSKRNIPYYKYVFVRRFIKCNFSRLDSTYIDIDKSNGAINFENVDCPLRGECAYEGVVCRPKLNTPMSRAELRVAKLWYEGMSKEDISNELYLSKHTVVSHIRNIYKKLDIHSDAEFVKYIDRNHLF